MHTGDPFYGLRGSSCCCSVVFREEPKRGLQNGDAVLLVCMVGLAQIAGQGQPSDARFLFHLSDSCNFDFFVWFDLSFRQVSLAVALNPQVSALVVSHDASRREDFAVSVTKVHPTRFRIFAEQHNTPQFGMLTDEVGQVVQRGFSRLTNDQNVLRGGGIFLKKHRPVHDVNFIHSCHGFVR